MKILFIAQYFPPEMGALASRVSELAELWTEAGCQVTVLTGFPNYPSGVVPEAYRKKIRQIVFQEEVNGYRVVRTWLTTLSNAKAIARVLGYVSFFISSLVTGLFLSRPDVIIASSPPLTVGLAGWLVSKVKRVPYIFEIRDIWPESITASGVSSKGSILIRSLRWIANFLYRHSGHIVVVSPAFKTFLNADHSVPQERISVIPNGVKPELFIGPAPAQDIRVEMGLINSVIVSYIGNYGWAQGLQTIIEAANLMRDLYPGIDFLFVGGGADEKKLKNLVKEYKLEHVHFAPQQPKEAIPAFIRASDICLVPLRDEPVFETVIPSKMLEFMAGARPVILSARGQAREILQKAGGGLAIEPQNPPLLVEAIVQLSGDKSLRDAFGENGREFIREHYDRKELALKYLEVLNNLVM